MIVRWLFTLCINNVSGPVGMRVRSVPLLEWFRLSLRGWTKCVISLVEERHVVSYGSLCFAEDNIKKGKQIR